MTALASKLVGALGVRVRGYLEESTVRAEAPIVLTGTLDNSSLALLQVDDYQRRDQNRNDIFAALKAGIKLPAIDLGMRGGNFDSDGDLFVLRDPVMIIDGYQRVIQARRLLEATPDFPVQLSALVHFNSSLEFERPRFVYLNKGQQRVSGNKLLRESRADKPALLTLYGLSHNQPDCPLHLRVCWEQNMARHDLVTATTLLLVACRLHAHVGAIPAHRIDTLIAAIERVGTAIGLHALRRNVLTFLQVVDECWGLAEIEYRLPAPQVREPFLTSLADIFSGHEIFWRETSLFVETGWRRKLGLFRIMDPNIRQLCGAGGGARRLLRQMLLEHLNSGRRTHRLVARGDADADGG
jgi:hypothetical protein